MALSVPFGAHYFPSIACDDPAQVVWLGRWRRGFWAPALLLFLIALAFVLFARNRPSDVGLPEIDANNDGPSAPAFSQDATSETPLTITKKEMDKALDILKDCIAEQT